MGKPALILATALLLLRAASFVSAQAKNTPPPPGNPVASAPAATEAANRIVGYTAWDDDFFYIALQVNKPALIAKNSEPFSHPLEDDALLISFQTDDDHKAGGRTAHTITLAVSAAGGVQLYTGEKATPLYDGLKDFNTRLEAIAKNETDPNVQTSKRIALLNTVIKNAMTPKGIPRAGGGSGPGYTVELAIPWSDLGGKPEAGAKMGFHVAAQSVGVNSGSPPLQSLSSRVKGASDLDKPALWGEILFSNTPATAQGETLISPRAFANKPTIDGELANGEWNRLSLFEFGERAGAHGVGAILATTVAARLRPEVVLRPPRPVVPWGTGQTESLKITARQSQKVTPLVFAHYAYWFQADSRKAAPAEHVFRPDGGTALAHHPLEGTGPWFSYDRADWHRRQLQDIRRAGIDVILPIYRGAARDRQLYADKGLTVLATALNYLRQSGQEYPQVALYLDTNALIETFGDRPDLRDPATQSALYGMIRDFYRRIPAPFRCVVPLSAQNGGRIAYPVFLSEAAAFKEFDGAFVALLRSRFAADFDGADLVVLGASDFKPKAALDGYFSETRDKGFQFNGDGWIKTGSVGAGYDTSLVTTSSTEAPQFRSRRDGETYRGDWNAALAKHPDWILIDGWNEYGIGASIAPTLETGYSAADLTRVYSRLFAGSARLGVKFLWHDAPAVMLPQSTYALNVRAQNTGMDGWATNGTAGMLPVAFAYRWLRDGQSVGSGGSISLPGTVLAGQNVNLALPISTTALPEGDYTLEISAVSAEKKGVTGENASQSLLIPVRVRAGGAPQWAATLVRSDLPTMLETGSAYTVNATLRNDGAVPWRKADGARVTLRLFRTNPGDSDKEGVPGENPIASADATAELTQDTLPGQEAIVRLTLPLMTPDGKPLPVWNQGDLWTYTVRWEIAADGRQGARPASDTEPGTRGVSIAPQPIALVDFDFGVRFTADGTPDTLPGDRRLPVRLSLQNVGPQIWKKEEVRVGYHWYYQDGTEFFWENETTPIAQDVAPGERVTDMLAWVTAPPSDGIYWLVWDVKFGDTWASTAASTRIFDQTVRAVRVIGGRLVFADLTKAFNLDGISEDDRLTDGDFDGAGHTFPAALMPPFTNTPVVSSSLWLPSAKSGPDSPRRISFRWGPKDPKAANFIVCKGQRVELGKSGDKCRVLHIVAASTGKDVTTNLRLIFQEPTSHSEDQYAFAVSRWDRPPSRGEEIAFLCRRFHDRSGVQSGAVALYHYAITIKEPRKLVALQLPNAPEIKIAAITLEK